MSPQSASSDLYRVGKIVRNTEDAVWKSRGSLLPEEEDLLYDYGLRSKVVGVGTSRVAVRVDQRVIKMARYGISRISDGQSQNKSEMQQFRKYGSYLPLLPILSYDEDRMWLEMPYAEPLSLSCTEQQIEEHIHTLREKLSDSSINNAEIRTNNLGMYDGSPMLTDYGDSD